MYSRGAPDDVSGRPAIGAVPEFARFVVVGFSNAGVSYGAFWVLLTALGGGEAQAFVAQAFGYGCGVAWSFLWNGKWTFRRLDEPLLTLQPPHYRIFTVKDDLLTSRIFEVAL